MQATLYKREGHEDLFAPSLALLKVSLGEHEMNGFCQPMFILEGVQLTGLSEYRGEGQIESEDPAGYFIHRGDLLHWAKCFQKGKTMKRGSKIKHQAYHSSGIIAASMLLLSLAFAQPLHAGPFAKPERTTQGQEAKLKVRSGDEAARLVKQAYGGKVLRVQSVRVNGNPGYRVKLLQDSGRIVYVSVDARSGRLQAN